MVDQIRTHNSSQTKLAKDMNVSSSFIGLYINGNRGQPAHEVVVEICRRLKINNEMMAKLPPYSGPMHVALTPQQPAAVATSTEIAEHTRQIIEAIQPEIDHDMAVARALSARTANFETINANKRRERDAALDAGQTDQAEMIAAELVRAADPDAATLETRLEQIRHTQFADLVSLAAIKGEKRDYCAIEIYGCALAINFGIPENDRNAALEARDHLIHALGQSKPSHNDALSVFEDGYNPPYQWQIYASTILINKADNYQQALEHYRGLGLLGLKPDIVTLTSLIKKADTYEQALDHYRELVPLSLVPNLFTFSSLISKADSYQNVLRHYGELKALRLDPNLFILNAITTKADSYPQALDHYNELEPLGLKPTISILNALIAKTENYQQALDHYGKLEPLGLKPEVFTLNALISKADTYLQALDHYGEMEPPELKPTIFTLSSLIAKTDNYPQALDHYGELETLGLKPNVFTITALIVKSSDFSRAKSHYGELRRFDISPDKDVLTEMIHLATEFSDAMTYFRIMARAGIQPDAFTIQVMVRKTRDYKIRRGFLKGMRETMGFKPDVIAYGQTIGIAPNATTAGEICGWMRSDKVQIDAKFLNMLRRKELWNEIDAFEAAGLVPPQR